MFEQKLALLSSARREKSKLLSDSTQALLPWQLLLDEPLNIRAQEAAFFVIERMRDPDFVHTTARRSRGQSRDSVDWHPFSLCAGDVGVAFMYGYADQCFPGKGCDILARQYLSLAAASTQQLTPSFPALSGGTSGIALALSLVSQGGKRYQRTLAQLHQGISEQVLQRAWRRPDADEGVADHDYDIISGAAGVLAYLVTTDQPNEQVQAAIEHLLEYLTWLSEPGQPVGGERWYIPAKLLPTDLHRKRSPQGEFNCGLAHGIPGPLAALALTWQAGYRYPGLYETIAYLAEWMVAHCVNAPWGIDWPGNIPLENAARADDWQHLSPTRPAWCYGAPGVARSLWLAGQALDDERFRLIAIEAIESALRRPMTTRSMPSLHLCHGVAGLLQICLRFAHECESTLVREQIPVLVEQILDAFDPASALGFCDLDRDVPRDEPAWLTGAPGVAMALLAASTPVAPTWDRALVIA